jgi:hypothetical protein
MRAALVCAVGLIAAVPAAVSDAAPHGRAAAACGVERWSVKTLTDPAASKVNLHPRATTVDALRSMPAPRVSSHTPRLAQERRTYRVHASLVEMKLEADSDVHLVIADPSDRRTMIVEFPSSACTHGANSTLRRRMSTARRALIVACGQPSAASFRHLSGSATITGVGFFDVLHGQTGVAPNGIELHPVLSFARARC